MQFDVGNAIYIYCIYNCNNIWFINIEIEKRFLNIFSYFVLQSLHVHIKYCINNFNIKDPIATKLFRNHFGIDNYCVYLK